MYKKKTKGAKDKVDDLIKQKRVDFIVVADYSEGNKLEKIIQGIIRKVVSESELKLLRKSRL